MAQYVQDELFEIEAEEPDVNDDIQFNLRYSHITEFEGFEAVPSNQAVVPENVPEAIRSYVVQLHRQVTDLAVYETQISYETFYKLSEVFYNNRSWPSFEEVSVFLGQTDILFQLLYKELFFRHVYSRRNVLTVEHRIESWNNYCQLFNYILNADIQTPVELPNQWIWDIVDEFIYQFQSFCQFRSKLKNIKDDALAVLKANPNAWNVHTVLNYLNSLINKSNILNFLENEKKDSVGETDSTDFSSRTFFRMIGYFSIVSLCRVHCLLGDYFMALKTLDPIDLNKRGLFTRVTTCYISLYYYMGFSYLMSRRYVDSIRTFSNILLYINRTKQYHHRSCQWDQIFKKNEHILALLAIAISLCPQRVDETIHLALREKYAEKMAKMQRGFDSEEGQLAFEELFSYACPKFINPASPNYEDPHPVSHQQEAHRLQMKVFLNEVTQQALLPTIRSYLKLYTTIGTQKLAHFLEMEESQLRAHLLCYKHKNRTLIWNGGTPSSGKWGTSSDIDIYVDSDMVHIADTKVSKRYGEFFIRHINRFEDMVSDLNNPHRQTNKRK
eukprot:TRINITY_DN3824_c0_g1_i1.p1 TRINITY_DN3824_c0_g1~~TRINITY_DN3824_c0_g1_i1.p1  ORF type:complete len:571 (-),score=87.04 TRINITY_DN3824_c0_g1_i1:137-1804(-)